MFDKNEFARRRDNGWAERRRAFRKAVDNARVNEEREEQDRSEKAEANTES